MSRDPLNKRANATVGPRGRTTNESSLSADGRDSLRLLEISSGRLTGGLAVEPDVRTNAIGYIVTQIGKEQLDQRFPCFGGGRFLDPPANGFDVRQDQTAWTHRLSPAGPIDGSERSPNGLAMLGPFR